MTDKAEWFSNVLKDAQALREVIVDDCIDFPRVVHSMCHKAADLIVQLATELEQVTQECDGLSIMLTAAQSASETYKRERDAAVEDLRGACAFCAHVRDCLVTGCSEDMGEACKQCPCETCFHDSNWQWRGVKMDLEDKRREN